MTTAPFSTKKSETATNGTFEQSIALVVGKNNCQGLMSNGGVEITEVEIVDAIIVELQKYAVTTNNVMCTGV